MCSLKNGDICYSYKTRAQVGIYYYQLDNEIKESTVGSDFQFGFTFMNLIIGSMH